MKEFRLFTENGKWKIERLFSTINDVDSLELTEEEKANINQTSLVKYDFDSEAEARLWIEKWYGEMVKITVDE